MSNIAVRRLGVKPCTKEEYLKNFKGYTTKVENKVSTNSNQSVNTSTQSVNTQGGNVK